MADVSSPVARPPSDPFAQMVGVVYAAIDETNAVRGPERALARSPDAVLFGEGAQLDSLGFVILAVTIEEKIEEIWGEAVSVIEVVVAAELPQWTVASLAERLAATLEVPVLRAAP